MRSRARANREDDGEGGADDTDRERLDDRPQQSASERSARAEIAADVWRVSFGNEQPHLAAGIRRQQKERINADDPPGYYGNYRHREHVR